MSQPAKILSRTEPFSLLDQDQLKHIVPSFHTIHTPAKVLLVEQGKPVPCFGIIENGSVLITVSDCFNHDIVNYTLTAGDMLFDMALLSNAPATSSAECQEETRVLCIGSVKFIEILERYDHVKRFFCDTVKSGMQLYHRPLASKPEKIHDDTDQSTESDRINDLFPLKAEAYIENNYWKPLTLDILARETATSRYHCCRSFKKYFSCSFKQYLNKKRVERARLLLTAHGYSVTDAGFAVGYNDASYFSRVFKNIEGYSPKRLCNKNSARAGKGSRENLTSPARFALNTHLQSIIADQ